MIDQGRRNVLGVLVDAVDYEGAVARVVHAAKRRQHLAVTSIAVHGVMTGVDDGAHRYRLNHFDLVTPDGQAVFWALNLLHRCSLPDRVCGPVLTLEVCRAAEREGLPIFLYGAREETLELLTAGLRKRFPGLVIAGSEPSKFGVVSDVEMRALAARIGRSGARMCFVGLGCPRQEVFVYECRARLSMPLLAVGAAFDFHAGLLRRPGALVQRMGLEWAYRVAQEPRRLAGRYLRTNPRFLALAAAQAVGLWEPHTDDVSVPPAELRYA
jgi:exopolysaccharide biosynthesis WecB/TagA/CpsF family protein